MKPTISFLIAHSWGLEYFGTFGEALVQVISFMNMKGGVGKTTLAVNVSYALAAYHHKKVLIIDGDPQFNASQYLLGDEQYINHIQNPKKGTLKDVFMPEQDGGMSTLMGITKTVNKSSMSLSDYTVQVYKHVSGKGYLDIIPSTLDLVEIQSSRLQTVVKLKAFIKQKATNYDYVIIDCPPTISIFTEAAILASEKYLVPIKPDRLSVVGLPLLEKYISEFTNDAGMKLEQVGIVFTLVRTPTPQAMVEVMTDLRKRRGASVFKARSTVATAVDESVDKHKPVFLYSKASQKTKMQFVDIAEEFLNRTGG